MKKIFRIARYDFKRLITNPITIVSMIVMLIICLVSGLVCKIEPTPEYTTNISGTTTKGIYNSFASTNTVLDTKLKLDKFIEEGKEYLSVQKNCYDYDDLVYINSNFKSMKYEVIKFKTTSNCSYTQDNSLASAKSVVLELDDFIKKFQDLEEFETNIVFKTSEFESLTELYNYFHTEIFANDSIESILNKLYDNISNFDKLDKVIENVFVWKVDSSLLTELEQQYITNAETKLSKITQECNNLYGTVSDYDTTHIKDMQSLITNYKLTCESSKYGIEYQLKLALEKHFGNLKNLYHINQLSLEETKLALAKINYFLEDDNLYYTQYQSPLNFNTASYEISLYDNAYYVISIVGFITIIFGIFCAYKLFGRDKKSGKIDIILSQNVTFGQVFSGKFLAIILTTSFILLVYSTTSLLWSSLFYPALSGNIMAIFNMSTVYFVHPLVFFLIKVVGIELQVIFYATITVFLMNISRKFDICFILALAIFITATICNILLNNSLVYCLFPFIHSDLTAFLGGGTMQSGFLTTSLFKYGNFFISVTYYLVIVILLYNFTKQLFKKN